MASRPAESCAPETLPHAWWLVPAEPWRGRLQAEIEALAAATGGPVFEPHLTLALGPLGTNGIDWSALADALSATVQGVLLQAGPRGHTERYFQTLFIRFGQHPDTLPLLAARREQLAAAMLGAVSGHGREAGWMMETVAGGRADVQGAGALPGAEGAADETGTVSAVSGETGVSAVRADVLPGELDATEGKTRSASGFTVPIEPAFEPHLSLCYANLAAAERERLASLDSIEGERIGFDTLVCVRPRPGASTMERVSDWDGFLRVPLSLS